MFNTAYMILVLKGNEKNLLEIDITVLDYKRVNCENILTDLSRNNKSERKSFEEEKQEVVDMFHKTKEYLRNINSPSKLKVFKEMLAPILSTINACENKKGSLTFVTQSSTSEPPNKKIKIQRTVLSTKTLQ